MGFHSPVIGEDEAGGALDQPAALYAITKRMTQLIRARGACRRLKFQSLYSGCMTGNEVVFAQIGFM